MRAQSYLPRFRWLFGKKPQTRPILRRSVSASILMLRKRCRCGKKQLRPTDYWLSRQIP
jgi:hypothetical protein